MTDFKNTLIAFIVFLVIVLFVALLSYHIGYQSALHELKKYTLNKIINL